METKDAAVLIAGAGGLGCPAALALARGGVGRLVVADGDRVELSNLHRQILHAGADLGAAKAQALAEKLRRLTPAPSVEVHAARVTRENVAELFSRVDFVIDATDDPASKFLLNDAAVLFAKPLAHGGVVGLQGQLLTVVPGQSACLRCLFPDPPSGDEVAVCRDAGILGPLAGTIGVLQAKEALKYLTGSGDLLADRLLTIDGRTLRFREVAVRPSPHCPLCGPNATIHTLDEDRAVGAVRQ